jgi:hypothetical protein
MEVVGAMKLFTRQSKWDQALAAATSLAGHKRIKRVVGLSLGLVAGVFSATAASAAVSSARHQDKR